jgi:PKD repeat protein
MTVNTTSAPGSSCYEVIFNGSVTSGVGLVGPYAYFWDFGDGTTSSEQNPSHIYLSGQEYTATLSVRDAKKHLSSKTITITPATPNIPPVLKLSFVSIDGYTVTLKDESYDPDYNQCGHSGPATLIIKWYDPRNLSGSVKSYSVNLIGSPSNAIYSYTYNNGTTTPTPVGIYYEITDNAGAKTTPSSALLISIPQMLTISGTIATLSGTPVSGVYVARKTTGGMSIDGSTTSLSGYYYFSSAIAGSCYVLIPGKVGYNFTPSSQTVCEGNTSVNFTAAPK